MPRGHTRGHVGKQVRAFTLDHDIGAAIDTEAELLGPDKRSALVNQLLREALQRRYKEREVRITVVQFAEATAALLVVVLALGSVLVFI